MRFATIITVSLALLLCAIAPGQVRAERATQLDGRAIRSISTQMSPALRDTLSRFQGRAIVEENLVAVEPRPTAGGIQAEAETRERVIPAETPFILPSERVDKEQTEDMKRDAPRDLDDVCASHRDLDIGVLEERIVRDPALADLLDFAEERGGGEPIFAIELTYEDDQVISMAPLSDSLPAMYLVSFGPMFEGKTILCQFDTEGIKLFDREGSVKLRFDSLVPEVNVREREECTHWICVGNCMHYFWEEDFWIHNLCGLACVGCWSEVFNPYVCSACIGCMIGVYFGCNTNCSEDVCSYCDCPDPTTVWGYVRHTDGRDWGGVEVRLAHCDGTPFGPTMSTTEEGFFAINAGGASEVKVLFDRHCYPLLITTNCYSLSPGNNELGPFYLWSCDNIAEVDGWTLHENESAWPNVEVYVTDCSWEETYDSDISDGNGYVHLEFPPGNVEFLFIRQECPGVILHTECMYVSQGPHAYGFNLWDCPTHATLTGQVLHEVNGSPWSGVTVYATDCDYYVLDQDDTDGQGNYTLIFGAQDFHLVFDRHCANGELYGTIDCMPITPGNYTVSDIELPECNQPPVACFTWSPHNPEVGQTVTFDASCSDDPDGYIDIYAWDFENDGVDDAWGEIVQNTYNSPDTYTVKLWVRDNDGDADILRQDVTVSPSAVTISGYVRTSGGSGIGGVVMSGLPGNPQTNSSGYYSANVDYGWSGTVTPQKTDWTFSPSSRTYSNVTSDQTNQNYTGTHEPVTISGYVRTSGGSGIGGVVMSGLPGNPQTNSSGYYSANVDYGWSGTVTPQKTDWTFSPSSRTYSNVTSDQTNQNYTGTYQTVPPDEPSDPSPPDGATDVILNPTLSAYVSDPNEDEMTVSFYSVEPDSGSFVTDYEAEWQQGQFNDTQTDGNGNLHLKYDTSLFGDGSDGNLELPGGYYKLDSDKNYRNVNIGSSAILNTCGYVMKVCSTLSNYGTITDTCSGGAGGDGGAGGRGGDPWENSGGPEFPEAGSPGDPGGNPDAPQAGHGGDGGGGGGGAGGSWWWSGQRDADGGDAGDGGKGGRGGGYVVIYAFNFDNHGAIHADGKDGKDGEDGEDGEYYQWGILKKDLAGGGGGGGAGGDGGDGGTVEIYYFNLLNQGTIHANSGYRGSRGYGGDGHCLSYGVASGSENPGASGADGGGDGGDGEHRKNYCSEDGENGDPGSSGANGTWNLVGESVGYVSYGEYISMRFDAGEVVDWTSADITMTTPSGTSVDVSYADDGIWYSDVSDIPDSRYLKFKLTLSTTNNSVTPSVDEVRIYYHEIDPLPSCTYYDVPSGSYVDCYWPGLLPNTTYCWEVVAQDASYTTSGPIWYFTTGEGCEPPEAIDDLTIALENGSKSTTGDMRLWWTEPFSNCGVSYYVVYRSTSVSYLGDSLASTSDTTFLDEGAAGDVENNHYYTVKAVNTVGQKSVESNKVGEFDLDLINMPPIVK